MKSCETCGIEIYTKDGENKCQSCDERDVKKKARSRRAAAQRRANHEVLVSLGLTRVRGALGGVYYE